jgi:hypothetical protein
MPEVVRAKRSSLVVAQADNRNNTKKNNRHFFMATPSCLRRNFLIAHSV